MKNHLISSAHLFKHLPINLDHVLIDLQQKNIELLLVGGAPRDYLLSLQNQSLQNQTKFEGLDFDFEVRSILGSQITIDDNETNLTRDIKSLYSYLKTLIERECRKENVAVTWSELPFNILKAEILFRDKILSLEFSPPRKEIYVDENFSHKNFLASYDLAMPYREALLRRDLTINAIMFQYSRESKGEWQILDLLNGVSDLEAHAIRPCSDDFCRDYLRYFRALRFYLQNKNNVFTKDFSASLPHFNFAHLSPAMLSKELKKSSTPFAMINLWNEHAKAYPSLEHEILKLWREFIAENTKLKKNEVLDLSFVDLMEVIFKWESGHKKGRATSEFLTSILDIPKDVKKKWKNNLSKQAQIVSWSQQHGNAQAQFLGQIKKIFFENSDVKNFRDDQHRDEFFYKWCGQYLQHSQHCYLLLEQKKVQAYVLCHHASKELPIALPGADLFRDFFEFYPFHLHINTSLESRGKGHGTHLMHFLENKILAEECTDGTHQGLCLMTSPYAQNVQFYLKLGYEKLKIDQLNNYDILIMGKQLKKNFQI